MRTELYTADSICKSLGLPSFASDPICTNAKESVRILLKPSFHPEICLTFSDTRVAVVCAQRMIWHQFEPAPMLTDRAEGRLSSESFTQLMTSMDAIAKPGAAPGIVIDGMPSELLSFRRGAVGLQVEGNAGGRGEFSAFIARAISAAWEYTTNPHCRNALADAADYVGLSLARVPSPPRKPTIETMVLGPEEDRAQLLEALRRCRDA
jgi:hypothetical protein